MLNQIYIYLFIQLSHEGYDYRKVVYKKEYNKIRE
jgi:hypothetical protein